MVGLTPSAARSTTLAAWESRFVAPVVAQGLEVPGEILEQLFVLILVLLK